MENIDEEIYQQVVMKQFEAAGDTQWINKEKEENPTFSVNKRWLINMAKIAYRKGINDSAELALDVIGNTTRDMLEAFEKTKEAI